MEPNDKSTDDKKETGPLRGKLLSATETSDWGNESRIVERGAKTEDGNTVGNEEPEELDTVDKSIDKSVTEDEPVIEEPVVTVEDPGEFTPQDYSFEITVFDDEGKNGKTVKVSSPEAWDELLEKDPNLGSAAALAKGLRLAAKMEGNIERDQAAHDAKKAEYDSAVKAEEGRVATINSMTAEIDYLASNGDLPAIDQKYVDANWADPEVAKQPGVKERVALLTFMRNENNKRTKLGLKPMTSVIDAFNAYERQSSKTNQDQQKIEAGRQRKAAAAIVAPPSSAPATGAPKGIAVGRGGSLRDLANNGW